MDELDHVVDHHDAHKDRSAGRSPPCGYTPRSSGSHGGGLIFSIQKVMIMRKIRPAVPAPGSASRFMTARVNRHKRANIRDVRYGRLEGLLRCHLVHRAHNPDGARKLVEPDGARDELRQGKRGRAGRNSASCTPRSGAFPRPWPASRLKVMPYLGSVALISGYIFRVSW